ncbi:MAG: LysE family translocator [Leptospiraceae bacterium]|jgi:threonine/homoserine/homoserine lactone efflux protein|nr:LysE family translocator [Leptospiraceae bacterium]
MIKLFLIGFIGVLIPGPDMLLVVRTSMFYGYKKGIQVLLGILTGNGIYVLSVLLGFSVILNEFISYLSILGGLYIIYLSFQVLKIESVEIPSENSKQANFYAKGLFTNLSNPKAMLYFASILLPALMESLSNQFLLIFSFFVGVILAFLMLIFLGDFFYGLVQDKKNLKKTNYIFFIIFFIYGIYIIFLGVKEFLAPVIPTKFY